MSSRTASVIVARELKRRDDQCSDGRRPADSGRPFGNPGVEASEVIGLEADANIGALAGRLRATPFPCCHSFLRRHCYRASMIADRKEVELPAGPDPETGPLGRSDVHPRGYPLCAARADRGSRVRGVHQFGAFGHEAGDGVGASIRERCSFISSSRMVVRCGPLKSAMRKRATRLSRPKE